MADLGTLSGEPQGKLGLEASKNLIFHKLNSKIGPNLNFAIFTKKSKISNCHKNWLVKVWSWNFQEMLISLLIVENCENFKEIEEPSLTALGDFD